jgi:hypothetical protein
MRPSRSLLAFALLSVAGGFAFACGDTAPYKTPASDDNFDDPDDPGTSGEGDPYKRDAAAGDASGRFCTADRDCPAAFRCSYAVASGCSAAGSCQLFDPTKCVETTACNCAGSTITYCLAAGLAPMAVSGLGACDGGTPADAAADGAGDATPD